MAEPNKASNGSSRNALRAALLDKKTTAARTKEMTLFGQRIELRQPTLRDIMHVREMEDPAQRAAYMIMNYACDPESGERIFETGDLDAILNWSFGPDLAEFTQIIAELTGVDISEAKEDLQKDPLPEGSSSSPAT